MKSIHPLLGVAILFTCAILASWGVITLSNIVRPPAPAQRSDQPFHSAPPAGYAIETNGKEWKWVRTKDGQPDSWLPLDSREAAIINAWNFYNYDHEPQPVWRLETPAATDPNAGLIQPSK